MEMKYAAWVLVTAGFIAGTGCCTKKGCLDAEINRIDVYGYQPEQLSHITVVSYQKGSAFTEPLDSVFTYQQEQEGDHYIVDAPLLAERDYAIRLNDTGDEFLLSDIATKTDKCEINGGPLCDYEIHTVSTYRVNGTLAHYDGISLKLSKP